jgi:hypothetical protein
LHFYEKLAAKLLQNALKSIIFAKQMNGAALHEKKCHRFGVKVPSLRKKVPSF